MEDERVPACRATRVMLEEKNTMPECALFKHGCEQSEQTYKKLFKKNWRELSEVLYPVYKGLSPEHE